MGGPIVAILLAAGAGTRFRDPGHKLLAELPADARAPRERVVDRALRHARESAIGPVVVVTGAVELLLSDDVTNRPNPEWARGQATSLQAGRAAAEELGASAIVVGLADQPFVGPESWRRIAETTDRPIAVATYDGTRGNPVRLAAEVWPLLPSQGDEGARRIMRVHPELVREVPCTGSADDIDTVEDLRRWQRN